MRGRDGVCLSRSRPERYGVCSSTRTQGAGYREKPVSESNYADDRPYFYDNDVVTFRELAALSNEANRDHRRKSAYLQRGALR